MCYKRLKCLHSLKSRRPSLSPKGTEGVLEKKDKFFTSSVRLQLKFTKVGTLKKFTVVLKMEYFGFTVQLYIQKMPMERQTV